MPFVLYPSIVNSNREEGFDTERHRKALVMCPSDGVQLSRRPRGWASAHPARGLSFGRGGTLAWGDGPGPSFSGPCFQTRGPFLLIGARVRACLLHRPLSCKVRCSMCTLLLARGLTRPALGTVLRLLQAAIELINIIKRHMSFFFVNVRCTYGSAGTPPGLGEKTYMYI